MDALIAGQIAMIRMRELHAEAEGWRRASRTPRRGGTRPPARSPVGEFDRWYMWRFMEPDPQFYCRRC
jgi:hypothetical protein